ncbi:MAG TPA: chemotaxis protein CheB [Methylomirabilota bacterium]|nr:chemotaxis protein CheB [Methylomirabilota bacterium]
MTRKNPRKQPAPTYPPKPVLDAVTPESPAVDVPSEPSERTTVPIVGIGASAGGIEAFSQFLRELPADTGMAFVLVQHLDPKHESRLPEILSKTTAMPVVTVSDRLRVEPEHVYVIPSNADMTIGGGVFGLTPRAPVDRHRPIDHFFHSLAREQGSRAIGVVLSGTGSDGTLGLRAIKAEGGITLVQDETSAKHPGMPQSARATADFVLPPAGIARELTRIASHPYVNHAVPSPAGPDQREDEADVGAVLRVLRIATGVDFSQYKPATVRRRITRRMLLQKIDDIPTYVRHLRQTPHEAQVLHDDILIQVTRFFRDPEGFQALKRSAFPSLVKERADDEPIRIWVPGCATGEEAYSLVICLLEFLAATDSTLPLQMFATDLSASAIARARAGTFPASIENEVSADRLRRFFVKTDGRYQISKAIRDICVFAPQDVTKDPPFSKLDLISCCNLLIYLSGVLQERVIPILHYALKPTGFLKLGPSESVGRFTDLFSVIDKKHKIYARKQGPSAHLGFGLTAGARIVGPREKPVGGSAATIEKEADRLILGRYTPAGVVVNADMEIVQFRGKTGPYLEATPGAASLGLFKMAREGLASALRQAVQQAARSGGPVKAGGLRVKANGGTQQVSLEVIPIGPAEGVKGRHHLILFFEERRPSAEPLPLNPARGREPRQKTAGERRVAQLAQELAAARQHLQVISEEHETAMEELRAATEEAQSSNEELQSTNEELETAKEELQATNEELTTLNDELNSRNLELGQLSNDLGNLLTSAHVPIIMVGADLRVRRMTAVTERALNMASGDIGRLIGDLRLSVEVPDLEALLREVIETLTVQEREVQARDGGWYSVRVRPYRTTDNKIDGAVISFVDIDALKRGFEQAKEARDQAQAIIATVRTPLVILDADLRVVTANRVFYETFRVAREETERQFLFDLGNRQWNIPQLRTLLEEVLPRDSVVEQFEVEQDFETIGRRTMLLNARRVPSATGQPALILLAIGDITEVQSLERERALRGAAEAMTLAKDHFLAVLSHELRTPLTAVLGWARMLRTRTVDQATTARALEVIERNTVLQVRLIEDLLDMSRIVAGGLQLETRPIMVAPVVEAALTAMQPVAEAKGIVLTGVLDEKAGPVRGDPGRLQQIVWNLMSNAIKFTPSGGRVDVHLAGRASAVEISVRDTGKGITTEQLPHIFTRLGAVHISSQSQGGGLGLGLAIVRHLVELHGGEVQAASAGPGQGATLVVTLPLTDEHLAGEPGASGIAAARELARGQPALLNGVRVLVVDDEADTRELLRTILAQCGAEVTGAANAREALEALEQAPFDVLVSDIRMPEEDGYDLLRKVRALDAGRGGQIPALALTAYARIEDREAALSAGYHQHTAKPIEPAELAAAVALLVGRGAPKLGE